MFSPSFDYYRAGSMSEARKLLLKHPGAKVLAGGHSLIPLLKLRLATPAALVDIGRVPELKGITVAAGKIRIGALTTHAELAASPELRSACVMLSEAAAQIGDAQVRNCGTIGGNVAHADPASDLPAVLLALDARFVVVGPNAKRTIPAAEFFTGMMSTALGEQDILTMIEISAKPGRGMSYAKFIHPASRYAVVGVAAVVTASRGRCKAAQIALGGLVPSPARASAVEAALAGVKVSPDAIAKAAALVEQDLSGEVLGDIFASAEYRKAMAAVYVKRALTAAFERAA